MVSRRSSREILHARFHDLPRFLMKGDVLVINTSRTRNAALPATRADGTKLELHLSTQLADVEWTVEVRALDPNGKSRHFDGVHEGEAVALPGGNSARLLGPYVSDCEAEAAPSTTLRRAQINLLLPIDEYLTKYGHPIRYNYLERDWPLPYFQTVYATESGSAEMPSAGRPFTPEVLGKLRAAGVVIAPLILHTGISNAETGEPPYKEFFRVGDASSRMVNEARAEGRSIVAVGTTAVRALEAVADTNGQTHPAEGWTCLVITPEYRLRAVDAMLTGFHEPEASHLSILEALAGVERVESAYKVALAERYLWHEFGDVHLILP